MILREYNCLHFSKLKQLTTRFCNKIRQVHNFYFTGLFLDIFTFYFRNMSDTILTDKLHCSEILR